MPTVNISYTGTLATAGTQSGPGIIFFPNYRDTPAFQFNGPGSLPTPIAEVLANGTIHVPYSTTIQGLYGSPPYTFAVSGGSLPTGLSLAGSTGVISGTPTATGTFTFTIKCTDSLGAFSTFTFQITINSAGNPVPWAEILQSGVAMVAYSETMSATGGTTPYTFAVTSGSLPTGLSMSSGGVISGTPTTAGTYTFVVTVTDADSNTGFQTFEIIIAAAPSGGNSGFIN